MRKVQYNNQEYILFQRPEFLELVLCSDGTVLNLPFSELEHLTELPIQHIPLVPNCVDFSERPESFVSDLQATRLQWLLTLPKRRVAAAKGADGKVIRAPRSSKTNASNLMDKLMEAALNKFVRTESPNNVKADT